MVLYSELQQQLDDALGIAAKANATKSEALQRAAAAEQRAAAADSAAANSSNDQASVPTQPGAASFNVSAHWSNGFLALPFLHGPNKT